MKQSQRLKKDFREQFKGLDYIDILLLASMFIALISLGLWLIFTKVGTHGEMGHWPLKTFEIVLSMIGTYLTMVYILLVSKGKKIGFTYGIIAQVFWGINALFGMVWFQIILRFGIFLPLTIYGAWTWITFDENNDSHIEIKTLPIAKVVGILVFIFSFSFLVTYLMSFINVMGLVYLDGVAMHDYLVLYMDIVLLGLGSVSTYLTTKNYSSSWYFWIITNVWGIIFYGYFTFAYGNWLLLLGMLGWIFYGINSLRAFYRNTYLYEIKGNKHENFWKLK